MLAVGPNFLSLALEGHRAWRKFSVPGIYFPLKDWPLIECTKSKLQESFTLLFPVIFSQLPQCVNYEMDTLGFLINFKRNKNISSSSGKRILFKEKFSTRASKYLHGCGQDLCWENCLLLMRVSCKNVKIHLAKCQF